MKYRYFVAVADEAELNDLASGHPKTVALEWETAQKGFRLAAGHVGVIWREQSGQGFVQPLAIAARQEEHQRLFGRFAQLRSDLSPLTAWCHLLNLEQLQAIDPPTRDAELQGWEAAWTGLAISEALLLSDRSLSRVKLPACLATQTFALARAASLWGRISIQDTLGRLDVAQRLLRTNESTAVRLRPTFEAIWSTLLAVSTENGHFKNRELAPLAEALLDLRRFRETSRDHEAMALVQNLARLAPEVALLSEVNLLGPEQRVQLFDHLVVALLGESDTPSPRRSALAMMAGYVATIAAGGAPSLNLGESLFARAPDVTAWAYVLGSVGERIVWTSSFDGLGRFVARELMRSLRLDEPPTCDIAVEEVSALADSALADPLVHLKIKQSRVLSVALLPGVNVSVSVAEGSGADARRGMERKKSSPRDKPQPTRDDTMASLADALWPYLRQRLDVFFDEVNDRKDSSGTGGRKGQHKLW